jgi:hypothetical protein
MYLLVSCYKEKLMTWRFKIQTSGGEVIVTNDGATILKSIQAMHPAAKMVRFCDVAHAISNAIGIAVGGTFGSTRC